MTVGSLFAGIGGIELGFKKAGFHISWANEMDKNACITYKTNHNNTLIEKDLRELQKSEINKVDIIVGGFPCQPFSIAGYQKGFKDDRGNLFFEILRIIDATTPSILFLENVKNLTSHDNGKTFSTIKDLLEQRGYNIHAKVLNSCDFGVPQNRERIYIVGFKDKQMSDTFTFPKPQKLTKKIEDLLEFDVEQKYYYTKSKYYKQLQLEMTNSDTLYQWRRVYVRENKSKLCPTLTANMGTGGHNVPLVKDHKDIRKLTPRECARFQGYSDEFILPDIAPSHLYKQIGNSVTVPLIQSIAKEIRKCVNISKNSKKTIIKKVA